MRRRATLGAVVVAVATLLLNAVGGVAGATVDHDRPGPLADGLSGPLKIDVTHDGDVLVGQFFAGLITRVSRTGEVMNLVEEPGAQAVADGGFGNVFYTVAAEGGGSFLKLRDRSGATRTVADLDAYERTANPDQVNRYGFEEISPECAARWPAEFGPPQYKGIVESNPYSIAHTTRGTFVADAAANAVFSVDHRGRVSTVAVLPPQPLRLPADAVSALGLPDCVAGLTYNFEPVPTDVELHLGKLYVSLLPGGPENPSLGARGSVYTIDAFTGSVHRLATGFLGATDVAVSPFGTVYVTELFGNRVSKLARSGIVGVLEVNEPAAVEWARGHLYVAYDVFGSGKVDVFRDEGTRALRAV